MYGDITKMFLFLAKLKVIKLEIVRGIKLLEEGHPEDADPKLINFYIFICT